MLTLDLYGPAYSGGLGTPGFVLPASTEEQETWLGRVASLPPLIEAAQQGFLTDYRNILDGLDAANAQSDAYWYSALGSRNTKNSSFYSGLEQLWRLDQLLMQRDGQGSTLGLVVPERHMLQPVQQLARLRGIKTRLQGGFPARRWLHSLRRPWGGLRYLLTLCDYGRGHGDYGPGGNNALIITVSSDALLQSEDSVRDFIFGEFPFDLAKAACKNLTVAQLTGQIQPAAGRAHGLPPPPIRTFVDLARLRDVFSAILQAAAWRPAVGTVESRLGIGIASLLHQDVKTCRWRDLPAAFLLRKILDRMLDRNPQAVLAHPFENNGWEHACQSAARAKGHLTVAFQHNALAPSSEKIYASRHRPHPNRIVAMGEGAKAMLCDRFGYKEDAVRVGYAMRQSAIYSHAPKTVAPQAVSRILVLLQGTADSVALLNLLADAFPDQSEFLVTLRPHPAIPLAGQLQKTRLSELRLPFLASNKSDLYADILDHDVAVFTGSTAGWEAVALAVPVVYVDLGSPASSNPMFADPALCHTAHNAEELMDALQDIAAFNEDRFKAEAARARQHFEDCFSRKTDDAFRRVMALLQPESEN